MNVMLENVDKEFLKTLKALCKLKKEVKLSKIPNKTTLKAMEESDNIIKDIKAKKRKPFGSWKEAKKDILGV